MLSRLIKTFVGSRNARVLKHLERIVTQINALEPEYMALSDDALREKTTLFKSQIAQGASLDMLLPDAFAAVREAGKRTLGMRHFDVQLIGGIVLHRGQIAEMSTGEGKTLMATLPAYLNALTGRPVHIVTVNPYLVERDANWMRPLYTALGLTVGVVVPNQPPVEKKDAYANDIIYATNNELGFDYLRDKMAYSLQDCHQGALGYAIIDEVDSILIDEARTPLIISGAAEDSSALYQTMNALIPRLEPADYVIDEKAKQVHLTEVGHDHIEQLLMQSQLLPSSDRLYYPSHMNLMHHVQAALRAHKLFRRDVDYLIDKSKVVIVDEHTGRMMSGRRWSDGLHQAIEAKENLPIENENQTLASITFQNFFRLYGKLAGMTGTADTEAYEFQQIYNLEVVVIPPNRTCQRTDLGDMVYLTTEEKYDAIMADLLERHKAGQPVLVGTVSIENSEHLSHRLQAINIPHQVLNAKYHAKEAQIIAEAGRPSAVTIATNMAGRGTDIVLGGNLSAELLEAPEAAHAQIRLDWQLRHDAVIAAGGLHILGTERHESRRIDNQLRGRAGRQGDPGSSQFYLALEDPLMRIFASEMLRNVMRRIGVEKGEVITHPLVSRAIENAQRKVEGHHFDTRKQLLQFDNVANDQRQVIYGQRDALMQNDDHQELIAEMCVDVIDTLVGSFIPPNSLEESWNIPGLTDTLAGEFGLPLPISTWLEQEAQLDEMALHARIMEQVQEAYAKKTQVWGVGLTRHVEKTILLQHLDLYWKEHLAAMDHLRQSIHLRGYAQKDPRQEYKREAFDLFNQMLAALRRAVIATLMRTTIHVEAAREEVRAIESERHPMDMHFDHMAPANEAANGGAEDAPKLSRNTLCPCGSQKKYKHCHGRIVE